MIGFAFQHIGVYSGPPSHHRSSRLLEGYCISQK